MKIQNFCLLLIIIFYIPIEVFGDSQRRKLSGFCTDGQVLYTPTIEMFKGGKKVLIVGMSHYGPKSYFDRVRKSMKSWIEEDSTSKVTILTELYTCRSKVLKINDNTFINPNKLLAISKQPNARLGHIGKIMGPNIGFSKCILDIDGINYRPSYVVERNQKSCKLREELNMGCQWNMTYPRGPKVEIRSGDIVMDQMKYSSQLIGSLGYKSWNVLREEQISIRNDLFFAYMIDYRDKIIVENVMKSLETSDRVIIPWGSAHNPGIKKLLEREGFSVSRKTDVRFADPDDSDVHESYKEIYRNDIEIAYPREGHCIPKKENASEPLPESTQGTKPNSKVH